MTAATYARGPAFALSAVCAGARRHPYLVIFAAALVVRLAYTLGHYAAMGGAGLLMEDSAAYLDAGRAMARHGALVREARGGILPETRYMPLYPLFLAVHMTLGGGAALWPVLSQALVDSASCVLIARLATCFDARLRLPAGLFAAINPTQVVLAGLVLTDSLFLFWSRGRCSARSNGCARPAGGGP